MAYTKETDFVTLAREIIAGTKYVNARMPPMDFVIQNLHDLGLVNVSVTNIEPAVDQDTTAWFDPDNPSYTANGVLKLWNPDLAVPIYEAATPRLFGELLAASSRLSITTLRNGTGVPANTIGENGDFYIREDYPGGIYGPKVFGAWPAAPIIGTYVQVSVDSGVPSNAFGTDGDIYFNDTTPYGLYEKQAGIWVLIPTVPDATTTAKGIEERATDAEAAAQTDNIRFVTPFHLGALETLITAAYVAADAALSAALTAAYIAADAVVLAAAKAYTDAQIAAIVHPVATDTVSGIAERATDAEATAGTDTTRFITPFQLAAATGGTTGTGADDVGAYHLQLGDGSEPYNSGGGGATISGSDFQIGSSLTGTWAARGGSNSNSGELKLWVKTA